MIEYNESIPLEPLGEDWQEFIAGVRSLLLSTFGVVVLWVICNAILL
jgi:hypothetical protein